MNLIFLGAPGAGKGTQAEVVCNELNIPAISTGNMLREAVKNGTPAGLAAKECMDRGDLVPDDVVIGILKDRIAQDDAKNGFILDGFPRTVEQADALAEQVDIDIAINIDVPDEELITRLTQRRSCPECNAVYHLANKPPAKDGICDKCGAQLYQRDDDKEETVKNRLEVYRKNTFPLIEYYEKRGKLVTIPGVGDISEIYSAVKKSLL
jgi:adenylate kinase